MNVVGIKPIKIKKKKNIKLSLNIIYLKKAIHMVVIKSKKNNNNNKPHSSQDNAKLNCQKKY